VIWYLVIDNIVNRTIIIRRIIVNQGLTVKNVKSILGLGCLQSIYRWMNGANVPSIDNLYALSNLFQMPVDKYFLLSLQYASILFLIL